MEELKKVGDFVSENKGEAKGFIRKNWMYLAGGLAAVILFLVVFGSDVIPEGF